jgi:cytochrome c2
MKRIITIIGMIAMSTGMLMAQDGATLFNKCAMCHGATGEGKMGPAIKGKDVTAVLTGYSGEGERCSGGKPNGVPERR